MNKKSIIEILYVNCAVTLPIHHAFVALYVRMYQCNKGMYIDHGSAQLQSIMDHRFNIITQYIASLKVSNLHWPISNCILYNITHN